MNVPTETRSSSIDQQWLFHVELGLSHQKKNDPFLALKEFEKANTLYPLHQGVWLNLLYWYRHLGNTYSLEKALSYGIQNKCIDINLGYHLFYLQYLQDPNPENISSQHFAYGEFLESTITPMATPLPTQKEVLRVGYVSGDFLNHPVAYFLFPLLSKAGPKIRNVLYSNNIIKDGTTDELNNLAYLSRNIVNLSDKELCEVIAQDQIDILVDLSGHTGYHRLKMFAHKPAPIQISYCGYPCTTGLKRIDYKIVDAYTDPPQNPSQYTERLLRLPGCHLCFPVFASTPEVNAAPFLNNGYITFGSLNNIAKINPMTIQLWSKIMQRVENSRLILHSRYFEIDAVRQHFLSQFEAYDIQSSRIQLIPQYLCKADFLKCYHSIDIALDPFPYNGTTTTFETLWMGIPVITLVGNRHVSRMGYSILSQLELDDCIAFCNDEYIKKTCALANNSQKLVNLRRELRKKMLHSSLCNAQLFTENLESCYFNIWKEHYDNNKR